MIQTSLTPGDLWSNPVDMADLLQLCTDAHGPAGCGARSALQWDRMGIKVSIYIYIFLNNYFFKTIALTVKLTNVLAVFQFLHWLYDLTHIYFFPWSFVFAVLFNFWWCNLLHGTNGAQLYIFINILFRYDTVCLLLFISSFDICLVFLIL